MPQIMSTQTARCGSNVLFQLGRSIGKRVAKRNTKGVSTAQGNWSRMAACNARVHGMSVPTTKFTPRTKATNPHPRKEQSQPSSKGANGRKKFIAMLAEQFSDGAI